MCRNEDFCGDDVVALRSMNRDGVEDAQFPIHVEPINDRPVILAPPSIFLAGNESSNGHQIYNKSRDTFQFSIYDPDLRSFPGTLYVLYLLMLNEGSIFLVEVVYAPVLCIVRKKLYYF
jgi:hypothetical protein